MLLNIRMLYPVANVISNQTCKAPYDESKDPCPDWNPKIWEVVWNTSLEWCQYDNMVVSWNRLPPKLSIYRGFSIINQQFLVTPIDGNLHMRTTGLSVSWPVEPERRKHWTRDPQVHHVLNVKICIYIYIVVNTVSYPTCASLTYVFEVLYKQTYGRF